MTNYRCVCCRQFVEPVREGMDLVSTCCDQVVETVYMCETCGDREQHRGCSECFPCILESVIADPREIDQCSPELQKEIAKGLAERLRPWLRTKQAA